MAIVIRTQDHIDSNLDWAVGHPSPALVDDNTQPRLTPTPARAPAASRQSLRSQKIKTGGTTLVVAPGSRKFVKRKEYGIISLFDGSGSATSTIIDALGGALPTATLASEDDLRIRPIVQEYSGCSAHEEDWQASNFAKASRYIRDPWDLVRNRAKILREFLALLKDKGPIVLVASCPAQDLTRYGPGKGKLGVCGEKSRQFNVIPVIINLIMGLQPNRYVFLITENAASTLDQHIDYMLYTLGLGKEVVKHINAQAWTDVSRKRLFIATNVGYRNPEQ